MSGAACGGLIEVLDPRRSIRRAVYVAALLWLAIVITPLTAAAETLDYNCVVGDIKLSIQVDTHAQTVRQTTRSGPATVIGEYSDGVYGRIAHTGAAAVLIPAVHQFVHITEELIKYGAELHGKEDAVVLNRRLATITLPNGKSGWCFQE
jgi:hypothetical protein